MFQNCVFKVSVNTKKWVKVAGVRAVKTAAETAVGDSRELYRVQVGAYSIYENAEKMMQKIKDRRI